MSSALKQQIGGRHYQEMAIQPLEFFHRNKVGAVEAIAIRYILRWEKKGGLEDLDKAIHTLRVLRELAAGDDTASHSASPSPAGDGGQRGSGV